MEDKEAILVERIKNLILEMIHYSDGEIKVNNSAYLSEKLGYNLASAYTSIGNPG